MRVFNERGLVPLKLPNSPMPVSSSKSSGKEGEVDSEATMEEVGETSPPRQSELLHGLSDDDDAGKYLVEASRAPPGSSRGPGPPSIEAGARDPEEGRGGIASPGRRPHLAAHHRHSRASCDNPQA